LIDLRPDGSRASRSTSSGGPRSPAGSCPRAVPC